MALTLKISGNYIVVESSPGNFLFQRPAKYTVGYLRDKDNSLVLSYPPVHNFYQKFKINELEDEGGTPFNATTVRNFITANTG